MSIFGWDLPPGVTTSMLPGNQPVGPCEICGRDVEADITEGGCICFECPECGEVGNPECYENHGLIRTTEQIEGRAQMDAIEAEERAQDERAAQAEADFWAAHPAPSEGTK